MRTVEIRFQPQQLSGLMAAMRIWLDERRFEPSSFSCHDSGAGALVRVEFKVPGEADAFARRFGGRVDAALAEIEQALVGSVSRTELSPQGVVG